ncbi:MAG TPA: OmpA family protein [Myxococcaceae bacterium]|jgi:outer membrane protein OmpA-like peptidoglycan-associated protein
MSGATLYVVRNPAAPRSRRLSFLHLGWVLALAALLLSSTAFAQDASLPSFELERLELNPSGVGSLLVGSGEILTDGDYRLSLTSHYERDPLVLYRNEVQVGTMVRYRTTAHLAVAYGLWNRLELAAQVPLVLFQRGDDLRSFGVGMPQQGLSLGTPMLALRVKLLSEQDGNPMDLSLGVHGSPEIGSSQALASEVRAAPSLMMGRRVTDSLRLAFNAGFMMRPRVVLTPDANIQDELGHELRLGAALASMGPGLRGEVAVIGSVPFARQGYSLEALGGARLPMGESAEVYAMGGVGYGNAPGTPAFRVLLGVAYGKSRAVFRQNDGGGDGWAAGDNGCAEGMVDVGGCVPKDWAGPVAEETPNTPDGQEELVAMVNDIPTMDTDGDSLVDAQDSCPDEVGPVDNKGCPVDYVPQVELQSNRIKINDTVHFDYNQATIQKRSYELLDKVARILVAHQEIIQVSIEGHTSSEGTAEYNRSLSQRRAESVLNFLASRGVDKQRMVAKGHGEDRPVATNSTEEGRKANRRVEFLTRQAGDEQRAEEAQ